MTGDGDDDYGDAFKKAKLEHDQRSQGDTEAKRLRGAGTACAFALTTPALKTLWVCASCSIG